MLQIFAMADHFQLSDAAFEEQFAACTLDASLFSHEAHLRLAWIHIKNYGLSKAIDNVCNQLVQYTKHLGAENKYNKTLTVAAVKAVYHFMQRTTANNFADFIAGFPRLKFNFKELMAAHYQTDIFSSEQAKKEFLEPDLLPFD